MPGNKRVNSDLDISGKIKLTVVPNGVGNILTYNTGTISQRTYAELISDMGLATTVWTNNNFVSKTGTNSVSQTWAVYNLDSSIGFNASGFPLMNWGVSEFRIEDDGNAYLTNTSLNIYGGGIYADGVSFFKSSAYFDQPDNPLYQPFYVLNRTRVPNLNADMLDGLHASDFATPSWVNTNFIPKTHPVFNVTQAQINNWDGWGNHRQYGLNNWLGSDYVGGGNEKPNSSYFGSGKLKLQMLSGSNLGISSGWYDVLWMSSYTGGDVKGSNALVFGKNSDEIGFLRQDYDSATWGTFRKIWHSGNFTPGDYVTLNTPQTITGFKEFQATGNIYYQTSLQVKGNGSTIYPGIGFHQPGVVGNMLQMTNDGWFQFVDVSMSNYAPLRTLDLEVFGGLNLKTNTINSPSIVSFLNNNSAQKINTGGILVSGSYADASSVPANGIYSKGDIITTGDINLKAIGSDHRDLVWLNSDNTEKHRIWEGSYGSTTLSYRNSAGVENALIHSGNINIFTASQRYFQSARDFPNGTLIYTNIDYSQSTGDPWLLEIKGNSYSSSTPTDVKVQGYIYYDTIIYVGGTSNNQLFTTIKAMNIAGKLCFWFPSQGYWIGYDVFCSTTMGYGATSINRVINVVDSGDPGGTKVVDIPLTQMATQNWVQNNFANQTLAISSEVEGGQNLSISGGNSVALTNYFITSRDGSRNVNDIAPNANARRARFDFAFASSVGGTGNYAGVMTYSPWDGTSASIGDSAYQLAFLNETGSNGSGIPGLALRKGVDTTWGDWYNIAHSGNVALSYSGNILTLSIKGTAVATTTINAGNTYTAGSNISISGNQISVVNSPTFSGNVTATAFYEGSLRKLKENIQPFETSGLELVNELEIVTFDKIDGEKNKIGIIADDSPEEFLSEEKDAVDLYKTIFVQAKAIQELTKRIKELEKRLS